MNTSFFGLYIKTLIASLILLGSVAFVTYKVWVNVEKAQNVKSDLEDHYSYIPSDNEGISFLLAVNNNSEHGIYMLIKTEPEEAITTLAVIPWQLMGNSGVKHRTLDGFAENGTGRDILNAVNSAFGTNIKKYLYINGETLSECLNLLGGIEYNVPDSVEYESDSVYVSVSDGLQQISGNMIMGILGNPDNFGKNTDGADNIGALAAAVLGNQDVERVKEISEAVFNKLLSGAETNLSAEDYIMRREALNYMLNSEDKQVNVITAEGSFDIIKDNFTPSEDFAERIKSEFYID